MSAEILKQFENDSVFAPYLQDDFDVQSHTSYLVQGVIIAQHLNKLSLGISKLEKEIEQQVGSHYEDLLSQATGIDTLEDVLNSIYARIQTLVAGVERVRVRVVEPYQRIESHTQMLSHLQATCELLRRVIRCLMLSQRLQQHIDNNPGDITKAASILSELDYLGKDIDLTGLEVLEKEQAMIRLVKANVEKEAGIKLDKGMESQNQTQVGTALQVFYNLGILVPSVEKVLNVLTSKINTSISAALDINSLMITPQDVKKGPGKALLPNPGHTAQFKAFLWSGLDKVMDDIYRVCICVCHLHKVLSKKRDPITHQCFLDDVYSQGDSDLFTRLWKRIMKILEDEFLKALKDSHIRQALEVDYPKLLRLYADLWRRLENTVLEVCNIYPDSVMLCCDVTDSVYVKKDNYDPKKELRNTLKSLEKAYLSRSFSRLSDHVNLMIFIGDASAKDKIDNLIKTIISELNVSAVDQTLCEAVAGNVVDTVRLFCTRCKQCIIFDSTAKQVIDSPSASQITNSQIVNLLLHARTQLERMNSATLAHLPQSVRTSIATLLPEIDALMSSAVEPLFNAISEAIEAIILTMHDEDFSSLDTTEGDKQSSLYMKELQDFINRAASDYLALFNSSHVFREKIQTLSLRCLVLFVRHSSLLHFLGEGGKMRLAADFAQMEFAISPLCSRPSELGKPYRIVRSFRPFLFQTPEHIENSPNIGDVIPYSIILHHLFSRAPPEMKSPCQTAGWSVSKYSTWLDSHEDERERLQLVRNALEAYVAGVRSRGQTEYASVYPVMLSLLEKGMKYLGKSAL